MSSTSAGDQAFKRFDNGGFRCRCREDSFANARERAAMAVCDTVGVILAGAVEPAARMIREMGRRGEQRYGADVLGTAERASAGEAALARQRGGARAGLTATCALSPWLIRAALWRRRFWRRGSWWGLRGGNCWRFTSRGLRSNGRLGMVHESREHHHQAGMALHGFDWDGGRGCRGGAIAGAIRQVKWMHALGNCGVWAGVWVERKYRHDGETLARRRGARETGYWRRGWRKRDSRQAEQACWMDRKDTWRRWIASEMARRWRKRAADLGSRWEIVDTRVFR